MKELTNVVTKAREYLAQIDTGKPEEAKKRIGELIVWLESWVGESDD